MNFVNHGIRQVVTVVALVFAAPACAQENLALGKSPAQLFASDCAICHKSVHGLAKSGGLFGLDGFLRQHYTASRESAAALAAYLKAVDTGPPAAPAKRAKRPAKGSPKDATKPADAKPGDAKPAEAKPADAKPADAKPAEAKPAEAKPAEAKPVEVKVETKPAEAKPAEAKPAESAKPAEAPKPN